MVNSLGFSNEEAINAWSKVSSSELKKTKGKPDLVIDFLKQRGLNNTHIKKLINSMPELLKCKVDETLVPKFNALEELGIFGSDLGDIVASNTSIIRRGFDTRIKPMISFIKSFVGTNEEFLRVLRRSYWLMSSDVVKGIKPNIDLLRKYGLSDEKILKILVVHSEVLGHDPKRLEKILIKVGKEFGISSDSSTFSGAVIVLASLSEETLKMKYEIFKSFGWTDLDIKIMVSKSPRCLILSETTIRERLKFFMNEFGCEPGYLANRPYVMTYSLKYRVVPRYTILQILKERKVITAKVSMLTAVCSSEPEFLKKYVLPYKDKLPELCNAYISREKGISPTKRMTIK